MKGILRRNPYSEEFLWIVTISGYLRLSGYIACRLCLSYRYFFLCRPNLKIRIDFLNYN